MRSPVVVDKAIGICSAYKRMVPRMTGGQAANNAKAFKQVYFHEQFTENRRPEIFDHREAPEEDCENSPLRGKIEQV